LSRPKPKNPNPKVSFATLSLYNKTPLNLIFLHFFFDFMYSSFLIYFQYLFSCFSLFMYYWNIQFPLSVQLLMQFRFLTSKSGMRYSRSDNLTKHTMCLISSQTTLSSRSSMFFMNIDEDENEQDDGDDVLKININF